MSESERIAKLEGKTEAYGEIINRITDSLDAINRALQKLVSLEERHHSLNERHNQLRTEYAQATALQHQTMNQYESRIRELESGTTLNSHGREIWEKFISPMVGSTISGAIVAAAIYAFLQSSGS